MSAISTPDLLRKDYKALPKNSSETLSVSINAASGLSLQEFFSRAQVQHHIVKYCESSCLDVLVIMFVYFGDGLDEPPSKQLAVCGPNQDASGQIGDYLSTSAELKLKQCSESYENCFVYDQENVKATRKDVFPLVHAFLQNKL